MASAVKPMVCECRRIAENICSQMTYIWRASWPSSTGARRSVTMVCTTREWMVLIFMFRFNSYNRRKENVLLRDMLFCICNGLCRRAYRPVRVRLGRQN